MTSNTCWGHVILYLYIGCAGCHIAVASRHGQGYGIVADIGAVEAIRAHRKRTDSTIRAAAIVNLGSRQAVVTAAIMGNSDALTNGSWRFSIIDDDIEGTLAGIVGPIGSGNSDLSRTYAEDRTGSGAGGRCSTSTIVGWAGNDEIDYSAALPGIIVLGNIRRAVCSRVFGIIDGDNVCTLSGIAFIISSRKRHR